MLVTDSSPPVKEVTFPAQQGNLHLSKERHLSERRSGSCLSAMVNLSRSRLHGLQILIWLANVLMLTSRMQKMKINRQILTARALQNIQIKAAPQRAVDPVEKSAKIRSWKEIFDAQLKGESDA